MSKKHKVRIGGIQAEADGGRAAMLGTAIAFAVLGPYFTPPLDWS